MKTNFQCIELTIQDEEFGCTITFSDSRSADDQFKSMEEIMNSDEKYLLIQRTYPEDDYDADYYYIESSESDEIFKPNEKINIVLNQNLIKVNSAGEQLSIGLNLDNRKLKDLERILRTRFKEIVTLIENN
ncbi:hypothetical protein [Gelidibacter japonicus]|uniref:hypothetical protein n=1 Tax=Gelidibacter japonicus TaxID=1962232 RepID=UPI002B00197A|nr:hypothetical protein [Gelidibacter japonicus]